MFQFAEVGGAVRDKFLGIDSNDVDFVAVCDNDDAGRKLAKFGDYVEVVPEGKDLGESPDNYVQYLVNKYVS